MPALAAYFVESGLMLQKTSCFSSLALSTNVVGMACANGKVALSVVFLSIAIAPMIG